MACQHMLVCACGRADLPWYAPTPVTAQSAAARVDLLEHAAVIEPFPHAFGSASSLAIDVRHLPGRVRPCERCPLTWAVIPVGCWLGIDDGDPCGDDARIAMVARFGAGSFHRQPVVRRDLPLVSVCTILDATRPDTCGWEVNAIDRLPVWRSGTGEVRELDRLAALLDQHGQTALDVLDGLGTGEDLLMDERLTIAADLLADRP